MPVIEIEYENPEICIDSPRDLEEHFREHSTELIYRIVDEIDCYDIDGEEMYPAISSFRVVKFDAQSSDDDYPDDEWKSITAKVRVRYCMEYA
jgi:hypothetical protein